MLKALLSAAVAVLVLALPAADAQNTLPHRAVLGAAARNAPSGGAEILVVRPDSPASRAGFAVGDIVQRIDAAPVANAHDFVEGVRTGRAGHPVTFTVARGGATQTLTATLDEAPRETAAGLTIDYSAVRVDGALRRALISYPNGPVRRRPAMLIIGGIGCYSIDDLSQDDPYRHLAQDLSRRGVVVMRIEKSGMGDSQGPACATVDFHTELAGYTAALEALKHDRRVDPNQIFLFGHSIGTIGAPLLADQTQVAGVIAAEGFGRSWFEYELINTRRQLGLVGNTEADIDAIMPIKELCMHRALILSEPIDHLVADVPDCQGLVTLPASQAYMHQLTELNVAQAWTSFNAPALVIYGTADFVTDEPDHRRLVDLVNGAHPGNGTLVLLQGMDHYLVNAGSQEASWQRTHSGQAFGQYDERFSTTIGDWICTHATCDTRTASR